MTKLIPLATCLMCIALGAILATFGLYWFAPDFIQGPPIVIHEEHHSSNPAAIAWEREKLSKQHKQKEK